PAPRSHRPKTFQTISSRRLRQPPADVLTRTQGHDLIGTERVGPRHFPLCFDEREPACVARQSLEIRAMLGSESLQAPERSHGLERLGIELDRAMRGEDPGAAAGAFLRAARVRGAVGAE